MYIRPLEGILSPMVEPISIRFVVTALYVLAGISYTLLFFNHIKERTRSTRLLIAALSLHFVELLFRGAEAGHAGGAPFVGLSGFMSLFSFLVGCVYLVMEYRYKIKPLGAFHLPVILVIQAAAAIFRSPMTAVPVLKTGHLFVLHVVPAIMAYAALSVSFVSGVAFLLLENRLKHKKFGLLMQNLPNLGLVERMNAAGVKIGLPLLTAGAVAGTAMGYHYFGASYHWDLKNWVTLIIIIIYTLHLTLRRFAGFRGKRAVIVSIIGYGTVIFGFTVVNMVFSTMHSFF